MSYLPLINLVDLSSVAIYTLYISQNNFWCPQQWRGIMQCLRCFYCHMGALNSCFQNPSESSAGIFQLYFIHLHIQMTCRVCARIDFYFANQIFLCQFLEFRARFFAIFCQKKSQGLGDFSQKILLSLTPLILVDY